MPSSFRFGAAKHPIERHLGACGRFDRWQVCSRSSVEAPLRTARIQTVADVVTELIGFAELPKHILLREQDSESEWFPNFRSGVETLRCGLQGSMSGSTV